MNSNTTIEKILGFGILGIGVIIAIILALTIVPFILMIVWNFVMPIVFGLPQIDFWQSLALFIVFRILMGNNKIFTSGSDKK